MFKRLAVVGSVVLIVALFGWVGSQPSLGTEPDGYDVTLDCVDGVLIVEVGEYEIGMASYRLDGDDSTWTDVHLNVGVTRIPILLASSVTLWVSLNGVEVDPSADCITITSSTTTTTLPPVTTTTSTVPPATTTTTLPPVCEDGDWECARTGPVEQLSWLLTFGGLLVIAGGTVVLAVRE